MGPFAGVSRERESYGDERIDKNKEGVMCVLCMSNARGTSQQWVVVMVVV